MRENRGLRDQQMGGFAQLQAGWLGMEWGARSEGSPSPPEFSAGGDGVWLISDPSVPCTGPGTWQALRRCLLIDG